MVKVRCVQKAQFGASAIYPGVQIIKFGAIIFFLWQIDQILFCNNPLKSSFFDYVIFYRAAVPYQNRHQVVLFVHMYKKDLHQSGFFGHNQWQA